MKAFAEFPHNLAAERAVLGAVLIENEAIGPALEHIQADDFYQEPNRIVFGAMVEMHNASIPIDLVTLAERLEASGQLEQIGGRAHLSLLPDLAPVTTNITSYARIIREKSVMRRLLAAAAEISERCLSGDQPFEELLDFAERSIFEITQVKASQSLTPVGSLLEGAIGRIEQAYQRKDAVTGLPTGLIELDKMLAGLQPSDLVIIAARPSMGKTAFALNVAQHAALRHSATVAVFSLEMSKEQLVLRMLVSESKVDASAVRTGRIDDQEWQRLIKGADRLYEVPVFIDDTAALNVLEIRTKARRLKKERGLDLIVVDYLQLMSGTSRALSREQEISEISRGLKSIAKELEIPVIALSQLNRSLEARSDKRPIPSDLRDSGAIEQDADVILFLYRDWVYKRLLGEEFAEDEELRRKAEVIIAKQRNGPIGTAECVFLGEFNCFVNPAPER